MPRVFPIYLFTGGDEHLKKEAVAKLKKALLEKDKSEVFNFSVYDAEKCDVRELMDTLRSVPFISAKRLVLLKSIDAATYNMQKAILEYAKNPSKHACFVLDSCKSEPSGEFYLGIKKYAREISYAAPQGNNITGWIQNAVKARGKIIHYTAAHLLRELKGDDINGLRCEIDKLVTYVGRNSVVSREDVERMVGSSAPRSVFEFVHALSRKDAKGALKIAKELSRTKKAIPEILGMIGWQFRRIRKAQGFLKEGSTGRNAGIKCNIPPFYVQRFMKEIKSFTAKEVSRNIDYLLDADYSIKRGLAKPQDALELLIVKICGEK